MFRDQPRDSRPREWTSTVRKTKSLLLILLTSLAAADPGPDARQLVERLGAPRYVDREAAAEALKALGREALPVLRSARNTRDPEIRRVPRRSRRRSK